MPAPLPLPPIVPPPPARTAPRRWPGQLLLVGVTAALIGGIVHLVGTMDDARASIRRATAPDEVRAVLTAQAAAWNAGDLGGYMAGYWNDDGLRFCSGGTVTTGWQPTMDRFRKRYQAEGKEMGRLTFTELEVVPLADDAALARGR